MASEKKGVTTPVQVTVSKQYKLGSKTGDQLVTEETIGVRTFVTQPATVMLELGLTLNLGNYEFAKLGVAISVPCYAEEVDDAYNYAKVWVQDKIIQERDAIKSKGDTSLV